MFNVMRSMYMYVYSYETREKMMRQWCKYTVMSNYTYLYIILYHHIEVSAAEAMGEVIGKSGGKWWEAIWLWSVFDLGFDLFLIWFSYGSHFLTWCWNVVSYDLHMFSIFEFIKTSRMVLYGSIWIYTDPYISISVYISP